MAVFRQKNAAAFFKPLRQIEVQDSAKKQSPASETLREREELGSLRGADVQNLFPVVSRRSAQIQLVNQEEIEDPLETIVSDTDPAGASQYLRKDQSIFLQGDKQCWLIQLKEISLLESEGNYTRVFFGKEETLILRSLNSLEGRLDPSIFFRASRKHIINMSAIEKIIPAATRTLLVTLRDGFKVQMSRRQTQIFRALMTL